MWIAEMMQSSGGMNNTIGENSVSLLYMYMYCACKDCWVKKIYTSHDFEIQFTLWIYIAQNLRNDGRMNYDRNISIHY